MFWTVFWSPLIKPLITQKSKINVRRNWAAFDEGLLRIAFGEFWINNNGENGSKYMLKDLRFVAIWNYPNKLHKFAIMCLIFLDPDFLNTNQPPSPKVWLNYNQTTECTPPWFNLQIRVHYMPMIDRKMHYGLQNVFEMTNESILKNHWSWKCNIKFKLLQDPDLMSLISPKQNLTYPLYLKQNLFIKSFNWRFWFT